MRESTVEEPSDNPRPPAASPGQDLRNTAVRSFGWALAAFAGNRAIVFVSTLVLARVLVPEDFGIVAAVMVVLAFLQVSLDLGFGAALVQQQGDDEDHAHTAFTLNLAFAVTVTILMLLAAPLIARSLDIADDVFLLQVAVLSVPIRSLGLVHDALLRRDLHFRDRTFVDVTRAVVRLVVSVALALAGEGPWALIVGMLSSEVTATLMLYWRVPYRPRFSVSRTSAKALIGFGGAFAMLRIVSEVIANADYIAISTTLGAVALGYYSIAFRLPELIIENVLVTFSQVAFPVFARARVGEHDRSTDAAVEATRFATLFGFTTAAGLALVAHDAIPLLFGSGWEQSAMPMALLAIAVGVGSVGYGVGDLFLAIGRPRVPLVLQMILLAPAIAGFILAARVDIVAVAWVHVAIAASSSLLQLGGAIRVTRLRLPRVLSAMRGALGATAGIVVFALPLRLGMMPGIGRFGAVVLAGCVGALVGIKIMDRRLIADLRSIAAEARSRV